MSTRSDAPSSSSAPIAERPGLLPIADSLWGPDEWEDGALEQGDESWERITYSPGSPGPNVPQPSTPTELRPEDLETDISEPYSSEEADSDREIAAAQAASEQTGAVLVPREPTRSTPQVPQGELRLAPPPLFCFFHVQWGSRHWCNDPFGADWLCAVPDRYGNAKYSLHGPRPSHPLKKMCKLCLEKAAELPHTDVEAWLADVKAAYPEK